MDKNKLLRALPRVDDVLEFIATMQTQEAESQNCFSENENPAKIPREILLGCIREVLDNCRFEISNGNNNFLPGISQIAETVVTLAKQKCTPKLRTVINATGVVLHTNLGRAPMPEAVAEHVKQIAMEYSTLEFDLHTGKRGSRTKGIENLLANFTNAEAACVVNNNAAAVLLVLSGLCSAREKNEVIVSRGELVEIGGSFRVPEVVSQGGAVLKEVGSTNRTRLCDYKNAVCEKSSAFLKVHTSNYRIMGFTEEVSVKELAELAREMSVLSVYDLGSGSFVSFAGEPTVRQAVADGVDILCFSGDKLLGGPQCGIILGKREYIEKLRTHPLYRALRADKLTLAALEATLNLYSDFENAKTQIPTLSMLLAPSHDLKDKAEVLLSIIENYSTEKKCSAENYKIKAKLHKTFGQAGGGALPVQEFESWAVAIPNRLGLSSSEKPIPDLTGGNEVSTLSRTGKLLSDGTVESEVSTLSRTEKLLSDLPVENGFSAFSIEKLEKHMRSWKIPIIARIHKDMLLLDVRTIEERHFNEIAKCLCEAEGLFI